MATLTEPDGGLLTRIPTVDHDLHDHATALREYF
jgi:hypothetical protein